jgi:hypothetical protein
MGMRKASIRVVDVPAMTLTGQPPITPLKHIKTDSKLHCHILQKLILSCFYSNEEYHSLKSAYNRYAACIDIFTLPLISTALL